jgi:hypothetical protein
MELKGKYNEVLQRHNKGAKYLDDMSVSLEEKEKWSGEFKDILRSMDELVKAIEEQGYKVTDDEILNGFGVEK